jgi:hypothetical protein
LLNSKSIELLESVSAQSSLSSDKQIIKALLGKSECILYMASSNTLDHINLWNRSFIPVIKFIYENAPGISIRKCVSNVVIRLNNLQPTITQLADSPPSLKTGHQAGNTSISTTKLFSSSTNINSNFNGNLGSSILSMVASNARIIDQTILQWSVYLSFACLCIEIGNDRSAEENPSVHFISSRNLFGMILPLLSCEKDSVRKAIVVSLGSVSPQSYRSLLDGLQPYVSFNWFIYIYLRIK